MSNAKSIREGFKSGRVSVPDLVVRKRSQPAQRSVAAPVTAPAPIQGRPTGSATKTASPPPPGHPGAIKVAGLTVKLPPPKAPAVVLSKARPKARVKTTGIKQSRIVIRLLNRTVPARLARKSSILEVVAVNERYRLQAWGVTSDGETVLPKRTLEVRLDLQDPTAEVEVLVEERPAGSRKKLAPKRWIKRNLQRPLDEKWRRPKAAI